MKTKIKISSKHTNMRTLQYKHKKLCHKILYKKDNK